MNRGQIPLTWNSLTVIQFKCLFYLYFPNAGSKYDTFKYFYKKITSLYFITLNASNVYLQALTSSLIDSWKIATRYTAVAAVIQHNFSNCVHETSS